MYFKKGAFEELERDIPTLAARRGKDMWPNDGEYWKTRWKVTSPIIREVLDGPGNPRAIILHHTKTSQSDPTGGGANTNWNSLYIARKKPEELVPRHNHQCELVGSDIVKYGAYGEGVEMQANALLALDGEFLDTIDTMADGLVTPSPAIKTGALNWYDPSNPLTSLQNQLQRFRFVRQRSVG
jgi:hypothetical protein